MKIISDHVLDIVRNSVRAKATLIEIIVGEDKKNDFYTLYIKEMLGGVPLQQKEMREAIIEWTQNNLKEMSVIR